MKSEIIFTITSSRLRINIKVPIWKMHLSIIPSISEIGVSRLLVYHDSVHSVVIFGYLSFICTSVTNIDVSTRVRRKRRLALLQPQACCVGQGTFGTHRRALWKDIKHCRESASQRVDGQVTSSNNAHRCQLILAEFNLTSASTLCWKAMKDLTLSKRTLSSLLCFVLECNTWKTGEKRNYTGISARNGNSEMGFGW